jgi:metal-responsive CopG/Arc/MetJ family transcriptional regulator
MAVVGAWIPKVRVRELDELANAAGLARSYFLARVIEEYITEHAKRESVSVG